MTPVLKADLLLGGSFILEWSSTDQGDDFGLGADGVTGAAFVTRHGKVVECLLVFRSRWDYAMRPEYQTN